MKDLKLYIWDKSVGWEIRFFCAMAETQDQARKLLLQRIGCYPEHLTGVPDIYEYPVAFAVRQQIERRNMRW